MKKILTFGLLLCGLLMNASTVSAQKASKSSVPSAEELEKIATTADKGVESLSKLIDAIDLSFLRDIDPSIKKEDVPFTQDDKDKVKAELKKGAEAVHNIDFHKVEDFLKKIEKVVIDFDPDDLLKDSGKAKKSK